LSKRKEEKKERKKKKRKEPASLPTRNLYPLLLPTTTEKNERKKGSLCPPERIL
jgi:hypothetical protein